MSKIPLFTVDSDAYYKQWQEMPRDPDTWQISHAQRRHEARKLAKQFIKDNNCKSILDCGCGIGIDYPDYTEMGLKYQGVDITPKFVEAAQRRGVPAQQASILELPFEDNSFDVVYCKDVLMHLLFEDWMKALTEMARVARKYVITIEPAWNDKTFYQIKEVHSAPPKGNNPPEMLMFFHNLYGITDVMRWASTHGLTVQKWTGDDPERTAWSGSLARWQLTVFTKD